MSKVYDLKIDGFKITEARGDMPQVELAHEIGAEQNELCAWEHSRRSIPGYYLLRICEYFNLPIGYFAKRGD